MIDFINGDLVQADWKYAHLRCILVYLSLFTHALVGSYGEVYRADCNGTVSQLTFLFPSVHEQSSL